MANSRESRVIDIKTCLVLGIACLFMINGVVAVVADETVFDIMNYDAKADGQNDDAMAFIQAWRAACDSNGTARVLIPGGKEFMMGEVVLTGPCTAAPPIVLEIQGNLSANTDPSSYSNGVWILIDTVNGVEVTGGGTINGHGRGVWQYADKENHLPVSLIMQDVSNSKLNNLNLIDSMGFHSKLIDSHDIVVTNLTITAPGKSPNTDGIHLSNATNVKITDCTIGTGDDCISVGPGSSNVLIARVFCGPGHGLSVGSLGKRPGDESVSGITITNCTLNGTTNGARIKTYHSSPKINASGIVFQDLLMTQVKNPVIIDQHYDSKKRPQQSSVKITDARFINIKGSTISKVAVRLNCSSTFPCEGIQLKDIDLVPFAPPLTNLTSACSNANFVVHGTVNPAAPTACA